MATRLRLLTKLHLAVAERFRLPPELAAEEGEPDDPTTSEPGLLIDRPNVANSWVEWIPPDFLHVFQGSNWPQVLGWPSPARSFSG